MNIGSDFELPASSLLRNEMQWQEPFVGAFDPQATTLTDSGRSAIRLALRMMNCPSGSAVLLPSYLCDSMVQAVCDEGLKPQYYAVNRDLSVNPNALQRALTPQVSAIMAVGYFGAAPAETVLQFAKSQGIPLCIDLSHSMLSDVATDSQSSDGQVVVASLRKLFPLADGGLVFAPGILPPSILDMPSRHAQLRTAAMIWKSALTTAGSWTNKPYRAAFLAAEDVLDHQAEITSISETSRVLLQLLDLAELRRRRITNYQVLLNASQQWGRKVVSLLPELSAQGICPLGFPVLCEDQESRNRLRTFLVQHGVFPPVHWITEAERLHEFPDAKWLQDRTMTIPCDHRYEPDHMATVADLISRWSVLDGNG